MQINLHKRGPIYKCKTLASFMAANGATLLDIGATLGHRSTQTTARYSHLVQDATHDLVRDTMGKVLGNKNDG